MIERSRDEKIKRLRKRLVSNRASMDRTMAMLQAHRDDIRRAKRAADKLCRRKNSSMTRQLTSLCIGIVSSMLTEHYGEKMLLEEQIAVEDEDEDD